MEIKKLLKGIKKVIKHPTYIIIRLSGKGLIKINDKKYIEKIYKFTFGKKPNLENPKTFNEKLQWLKLYDKNPEYTKMVDKYEVRKYIKDTIGEEYLIPLIGVYSKFEEIDFNKLPNQFVIKCTHDSGSAVICKNKEKFNYKACRKKINKALKQNYFYAGREWPYKNVKPRIIIEEYINSKDKTELIDYKFMCFNGKVECSFVCLDRGSKEGLKVDFYDLEWKKMPFERHYPNSDREIEKPKNYDLMINLAERLAQKMNFVRVDFYEVDGKIYFGELTFFPGSGFEEFRPEKYDTILGELLKMPKKIMEG